MMLLCDGKLSRFHVMIRTVVSPQEDDEKTTAGKIRNRKMKIKTPRRIVNIGIKDR